MPQDNEVLLRSNGWCGDTAARGGFSEHAPAWAAIAAFRHPEMLAGRVPAKPDMACWKDPQVGWGVILPDRDDLTDAEKAEAIDAPDCIRKLIGLRSHAPVFRHRTDLKNAGLLQRYYPDKAPATLNLSGERGMGNNQIPRYLLIVGSPEQIPWSFQYRVQTQAFVGRLDLDEAGLNNYVEGLLNDWKESPRNRENPLVWSVNHGTPDISHLMAKTIGERLHKLLVGSGFNSLLLTNAQATLSDLYEGLNKQNPAFLATTSHGATFPLDRPEVLIQQLGLPVDNNHALLDIKALQEAWNPHGAIWYAHACCSAGADKPSTFKGMVDETSSLGQMLEQIAIAGPCSAPLPRALLGSKQPLAAFIGHVEPTFDWTLRDPRTGQVMTKQLIMDTLFHGLHADIPLPVGLAIDGYYDAVAGLLLSQANALGDYNHHAPDATRRMLEAKLLAMDRLTMVTLGDPTVTLPPPTAT